MENNSEQTKEIDLTSALPIEIRYIILSFLPLTDQFCVSLVSRSWKSAWDLLTSRDFDEILFKQRVGGDESSFVKFVDYFIHTHRSFDLQTFRLHMVHNNNANKAIDRWMKLLPKRSLKVLELSLEREQLPQIRYTLPPSVMALNSLNFLSLKGCDLSQYYYSSLGQNYSIEFTCLKELHLDHVHIEDSRLLDIINCCPMITILSLVQCTGTENLSISSLPNLLSVYIDRVLEESRVEIHSSTLQSYYYRNGGFLDNLPHLMCTNLRHLTLKAARFAANEKQFESLISNLPLLRVLDLHFWGGMRVIRISSLSLKTLKIHQDSGLCEARIHAPSLEELQISLSSRDIHHLKSSVSIDAPKLHKIELSIQRCNIFSFSRPELRDFLTQFVQKIILNLEFELLQVTWNRDDVPALPPVAIEHLNLIISKEIPRNCGPFLEGLFWSCRPQSLSLRLSHNLTADEIYLNSLCELIERVDNPILICCNSSEFKCWRHYLKSSLMTLANDGHIIDCKDFLKRACRFNADKSKFPGNSEFPFPNLEIDFHFLWISV